MSLMPSSSYSYSLGGAWERTPSFSSSLQLHFPPLSLLCPSSFSHSTTANNSVGVTYVNYLASATGENICNTHTHTHVDSSHTTESVSKHVSLKQRVWEWENNGFKDKGNGESEEMSWRRMPDVRRREEREKVARGSRPGVEMGNY